MKRFHLIILLLSLLKLQGQVGIATTSPQAALDVVSTNMGFLAPRVILLMTTSSMPVTSPGGGPIAVGTMVYNTNTQNDVTPGYYYWNGTAWVRMAGPSTRDWALAGNASTVPGTDFLGTTDNQELRIKTNNADRFSFTNNGRLRAYDNGTTALPTYSWNGDDNTGFWRPGADVLGFSTNALERFRIPNEYQVHAMGLGTAALPFYSYGADPNTGLYSPLADNLGLSTAGVERFRVPNANQVHAMSLGTAALPFYTFGADPDTGIFSPAANTLSTSTTGLERMRIHPDGRVTVNSTTAVAGDQFAAYGTVSPLNSYSTGLFGTYTRTTGASAYALYATTNGANSYGSFSVSSGTNGVGSFAVSSSPTGFGLWGNNQAGLGTGSAGAGNNQTAWYLNNGSGGAFTGLTTAVYGRYQTGGVGSGAVFQDNFAQQWDIGYWSGAQYYKIIGTGAVSTVVDGLDGEKVVMHCTETPENLFEDYGIGKLINGRAHIEIDPIFAKNIRVDEKHPLKVFVQLEGECNGVYVTNKSQTSFDVVELQSGTSNVAFSYSIVATRANETAVSETGETRVANYSQRFEKAPELRKSSALTPAKPVDK